MQTVYHYDVKQPKQMQENKKYPLLIAMHGIGYNEQYMLDLFEGVTEEFIVVAPRGNLTYEEGFAYYELIDYGKPNLAQFDDAIVNLQQFIKDVLKEYPIDRDHIYLAGFSQGAILANSLALVLGKLIRGIVPMNGYVPEFIEDLYFLQAVDHLNVMLTDGRDDEIFPPEVGEKSKRFFKQRGAAVNYHTYPTGHEIGEANKIDVNRWLLSKIRTVKN